MNGKDTKKSQAWTDEEYELDPLTSAIQFKVTSGTAYDYVCKKETKSQTTEKRYYISAIGEAFVVAVRVTLVSRFMLWVGINLW